MHTENKRLTTLFTQYIDNTLNEEEYREFTSYLDNPLFQDQLGQLISHTYENPTTLSQMTPPQREAIVQRITQADTSRSVSIFRTRKIWTVAAAILFILGLGYIFFPYQNTTHTVDMMALDTVISPGRSGGRLVYADGTTLNLDESKAGLQITDQSVRYADGTPLNAGTSKSKAIEAMVSTDYGQTYRIALPDGSQVWLNAGSQLHFRTDLHEAPIRRVKLIGEGYFKVSKDLQRPFVVEADNQKIEVLGTEFNISNYPQEHTATTLLGGSIKLSLRSSDGRVSRILKPNEQATDQGQQLLVQTVDARTSISWMNGDFNFNDETVQQIMNKVARWYNVEIIYQPGFKDQKLMGTISKFENIDKVLKMLEYTGTVKFKIEGRRIFVMN
ncbi:FecR family protein [Sphingobacterium nematocida]|uniref:FecR family protein n=1 Tax=Sphingobacterium nematocida TaxID=1513896 RepID=A0A1T5AZV5_9SPHI|nr:FecR domain-containing protein [Sphingobacterium nematocida]SKB40359.1 FecR family protein [Sphingobacterium nematocida]